MNVRSQHYHLKSDDYQIKYPGDFLSLDPKLLGVEEVKGKTIYKGFRIAVGLHTTNGQYETDPVSGWVSPVGDAPLYMEKILYASGSASVRH